MRVSGDEGVDSCGAGKCDQVLVVWVLSDGIGGGVGIVADDALVSEDLDVCLCQQDSKSQAVALTPSPFARSRWEPGSRRPPPGGRPYLRTWIAKFALRVTPLTVTTAWKVSGWPTDSGGHWISFPGFSRQVPSNA